MGSDLSEKTKILNVIDFINHYYGGFAEVTGEVSCAHCNLKFPEGQFRYNRGGYIPGPDVLNLSVERTDFPIHKLHTFFISRDSNEKDKNKEISQLFYQSRNWNYYNLSQRCFKDYLKIMKTSSLLSLASLEADHWYYEVHSTPDFLEENGKLINSKSRQLEGEVKLEINHVFREIIGDKKVPLIYIVPKKLRGDIGDEYYKLKFIENTYNTFKAKNIFFPNKQASSVIKTIDSYFKEVKSKYEKNPLSF